MKRIFILILTIISFSTGSIAQSITINPNGASALIDANSTSKGFLPPRMSMAQRSALTLIPGLQVYCHDCSPAGPYSYDGAQWKAMFNINSTGPIYSVGQQAQGGTVIWVDDSGQHGIVAAPYDISQSGISWAPDYSGAPTPTFVLAMGQGMYDGEENTRYAVNKMGWQFYAAFMCRQTSFNGYGGWYLPSMGELAIMYQNRNLLGIVNNPGNGAYTKYWSSTESTPYEAVMIDFGNGQQVNTDKTKYWDIVNFPYRARSVRRF